LSTDANDSGLPPDDVPPADGNGAGADGHMLDRPIDEELKDSYLTYSMSVIVSRALPDVRDGLKPSQRRILVAMNDLNLGPNAGRVKCAKISGDTSGNYHPHGESVIYPTLVRMAQEWNMRQVLVDKQGNFGSIAGLPPAAMRYTEARLSATAALMLDDINLDTVDYVPTYDERNTEPTVLPSRYPNLVINGAMGIAVGMATSIPPHNPSEVCEALIRLIDNPHLSVDEILEIVPGPDFPTGGVICGRAGIRKAYHTGRGNVVVRARARIEEYQKGKTRIVVSEIPFQQFRDRLVARMNELVNEGRIKGVSEILDESDLKEPVRICVYLKRDGDAEVILNQFYQFSPLQISFSIILLALVDGKPREMSFKALLEEFLRHRATVIRRRTQFLLARARKRKHTVEGLLLALANIEEIIRIIRTSETVAQAKTRLMGVECPASMMHQALGDEGFKIFQDERGAADVYHLTPVQADAILRMTLSQLVNLAQEQLAQEHRDLLAEIQEYLRILSDEQNILDIIKDELREIQKKHGDARRTEISGDELGEIDLEDLIEEETMVVSISHRGYIKRTPMTAYRAQRRGGKGIRGAATEEEDPIQHLFVASTHDYLMFFTNKGIVHWRKVYDLPQLSRERKGRAVVNLLQLTDGERIADCRAVRDFDQPEHYLVMATRKGLVKKTVLSAYGRPMKRGIIAIKLREDDEVVDVLIAKSGDELVLSTAGGMAIRFRLNDVRATGRSSSGVKGISLRKLTTGEPDYVVGMVVADPDATLLTACEHGFGKRTWFGPNAADLGEEPVGGEPAEDENGGEEAALDESENGGEGEEEGEVASGNRYRTQGRAGKGVRDIKTTKRNGRVVAIARVDDEDEVLMMTARGKIQRIAASDINVIGRNTQGVRIMTLDEDDTLAAVVRVPAEERGAEEVEG
jgi:DNA gyrase subunit A